MGHPAGPSGPTPTTHRGPRPCPSSTCSRLIHRIQPTDGHRPRCRHRPFPRRRLPLHHLPPLRLVRRLQLPRPRHHRPMAARGGPWARLFRGGFLPSVSLLGR
uniref:Uncharacterized protein n=1 Tax=Opuntia streptacantha TaxID=393608 RepID=A0A7C9AGL2_OPUST